MRRILFLPLIGKSCNFQSQKCAIRGVQIYHSGCFVSRIGKVSLNALMQTHTNLIIYFTCFPKIFVHLKKRIYIYVIRVPLFYFKGCSNPLKSIHFYFSLKIHFIFSVSFFISVVFCRNSDSMIRTFATFSLDFCPR